MNISSTLYGQMTGILKPYARKQNLVLTSRRRKSGAGDEGFICRRNGDVSSSAGRDILFQPRAKQA
ncbi:hypothetical protein QNN00_16930 [Bacillus velezensis]|nr:hypothetical protein [Bacillus velezensis]